MIGNVLVYRDNHHLTAQYSRSLAPFLTAELARLKTEKFAKGKLNGILPDAPSAEVPHAVIMQSSARNFA